MRATLTLERDVADRIQDEIRRTGKEMKAVVNEALRRGLAMAVKPARAPRFKVQPHAFGFKPGIDLDRMHQPLDELSAAEEARKLRQ